MLIEFWLLFVPTLRGQYNDMQGLGDVLWQLQLAFKKRWQGLHLFSDITYGLRWNYAIGPYLLFCCMARSFFFFQMKLLSH